MSFIGKAFSQFLNTFVTQKMAQSQAMRQAAGAAVKGVRSIKEGAKTVGKKFLG